MDTKYKKDLLYNMWNIESFNIIREAGLFKSNVLEWTGLRLAVPPSLRVDELNSKDIFDLESFSVMIITVISLGINMRNLTNGPS